MEWLVVNGIFPIKPQFLFSRYLVGGIALREARTVTRRQMFLQSSNLGVRNPLIAELAETVTRYNNTVNLLAQTASSVQDICYANRVLVNDPAGRGGIIRQQPFVHKLKNNKIQLPPPEELENCLEAALNHLRSDSHPVEKALYCSAMLLGLHPFFDGNGRTARALFDAVMLKHNAAAISPFYFIFQKKNMQQHIRAVVLTATSSDFSLAGEFWCDYKTWQTDATKQVNLLLAEANRIVSSRLLMLPLSASDVLSVNSLWLNPIVNPNSGSFSQQLISVLIKAGLLVPKRTAYGVVYCCDAILSLYEKLDNALLSSS